MIKCTVIASLLLAATTATAQTPAKTPSSLEEQLAAAMRANPEVLLAEAKVRQAQAELNHVRLRVTREVIAAHHEQELLEQHVRTAAMRLEAAQRRASSGMASTDEELEVLLARSEAQARLAEGEATLKYLLGTGGTMTPADDGEKEDARPIERPPIPEKYRQVLDKRVSFMLEGSIAWPDAATRLQTAIGDELMKFFLVNDLINTASRWNLECKDVPLRSALEMICDHNPIAVFVFKDYGVLITKRGLAAGTAGATIPELGK